MTAAHPVTTGPTTSSEPEEPPMTATEAPLPRTTPTARSGQPPSSGARSLRPVLRSEVIKATTVRVNKGLLATAAIVGLLTSWAIARATADDPQTATEVFAYPVLLAAVLAAVAGIVLFTSEVQHGTLAGSLTAHPSRWPIAGAKAVVAAGLGFALGAIGMATGFAGALAGGLEVGDTSGLVSTVLWGLLYTVGSALLGLGVGMVVRHSAAAISGLLVWWLVVEGLVVSFAPVGVVRFVPFDTGFRTLGVQSDLDVPEVAAAVIPNVVHASIFWAYVVAALAVGLAVLVRRDPD